MCTEVSNGGVVCTEVSNGGVVYTEVSNGGVVCPEVSNGGVVCPEVSNGGGICVTCLLLFCFRLAYYLHANMLTLKPLKVKQPIFLHLNLCNVKPSATSDTERNFSFKVTSPTRVILLQADSTQGSHAHHPAFSHAHTLFCRDAELDPGDVQCYWTRSQCGIPRAIICPSGLSKWRAASNPTLKV